MTPESSASLTLRAATATDQDFLRAVFASTRADELSALPLDAKQMEFFVTMQFNAQSHTYSRTYPSAENSVILFDEQPIGRMLVDRAEHAITLVDIALVGEYRNRGLGSILIRRLMDEAAASHKPVRLSVYKFNPAARLYQRLGFSEVSEQSMYVEMEWLPDSG